MSEDLDQPSANRPDPHPSGAIGEYALAVQDPKVERTVLLIIQSKLESGRFTEQEEREVRTLVLERLRTPDVKNRSLQRYVQLFAMLERNDLAKVKIALDAVQAAKQKGDIHVHGGTGALQVNIAQQISELRKAAPTAEERRAMLDALDAGHGDNGNGNGNGNGHGSNGNGHH